MHQDTKRQWTPSIIVTDRDRDRLSALAVAAMERSPDVAEELMDEMERATVVPSDALPPGVIKMGSTVEFKFAGQQRRVTVVFPGDADISQGRISILTPVGAALIGLSEGQSIMWMTRDGRAQKLTVIRVEATNLNNAAAPGSAVVADSGYSTKRM